MHFFDSLFISPPSGLQPRLLSGPAAASPHANPELMFNGPADQAALANGGTRNLPAEFMPPNNGPEIIAQSLKSDRGFAKVSLATCLHANQGRLILHFAQVSFHLGEASGARQVWATQGPSHFAASHTIQVFLVSQHFI